MNGLLMSNQGNLTEKTSHVTTLKLAILKLAFFFNTPPTPAISIVAAFKKKYSGVHLLFFQWGVVLSLCSCWQQFKVGLFYSSAMFGCFTSYKLCWMWILSWLWVVKSKLPAERWVPVFIPRVRMLLTMSPANFLFLYCRCGPVCQWIFRSWLLEMPRIRICVGQQRLHLRSVRSHNLYAREAF